MCVWYVPRSARPAGGTPKRRPVPPVPFGLNEASSKHALSIAQVLPSSLLASICSKASIIWRAIGFSRSFKRAYSSFGRRNRARVHRERRRCRRSPPDPVGRLQRAQRLRVLYQSMARAQSRNASPRPAHFTRSLTEDRYERHFSLLADMPSAPQLEFPRHLRPLFILPHTKPHTLHTRRSET